MAPWMSPPCVILGKKIQFGITVFFRINALGVYKIFTILGGAFIGEGRLFKRNRILTIGSFLFSMFLNYDSISMINALLAFTRKTMMDQENWLAMPRLSFQAYCIIFFKQQLKIVSTLK